MSAQQRNEREKVTVKGGVKTIFLCIGFIFVGGLSKLSFSLKKELDFLLREKSLSITLGERPKQMETLRKRVSHSFSCYMQVIGTSQLKQAKAYKCVADADAAKQLESCSE